MASECVCRTSPARSPEAPLRGSDLAFAQSADSRMALPQAVARDNVAYLRATHPALLDQIKATCGESPDVAEAWAEKIAATSLKGMDERAPGSMLPRLERWLAIWPVAFAALDATGAWFSPEDCARDVDDAVAAMAIERGGGPVGVDELRALAAVAVLNGLRGDVEWDFPEVAAVCSRTAADVAFFTAHWALVEPLLPELARRRTSDCTVAASLISAAAAASSLAAGAL